MNIQTIQKLFELCNKTDVDLKAVENFIISSNATGEEITRTAIKLADENSLEIINFEHFEERSPAPDELVSSNFIELFDLFICHGLLPNYIYSDERAAGYNIMEQIQFIDNGNIAPIVLRKLLEAGGNPNLVVENDTVFRNADFDVVFDAVNTDNTHMYDIEVKVWLVLMGYGGILADGRCPVEMKEGYSVEIFREFEKFHYKIEFENKDWTMYIFDKSTKEVVATL